MNGRDLLSGMTHVQDVFIMEAMEEIQKKSKIHIGRLFVIAAILSLISISVVAGNMWILPDDWFNSFFADESVQVAQQLSENQQYILDSGLTEINQSVTDQGYTITMESGLCDGYRMLIKCRIDAPTGIVLDGRNYGLSSEIKTYSSANGERIRSSIISNSSHLLLDEDSNDNSVSMLLEVNYQPKENAESNLARGMIISVMIPQIIELSGFGEEAAWNCICEGNWEFKIEFDDDLLITDSREMLEKPIKCNATMWVDNWLLRNKKIPLSVKAISFELRPLSATLKIRRPLIAWFAGVDPVDPIQIVLKNGTIVSAQWKLSSRRSSYDECYFAFNGPVVIDDIDYVEFPGGIRIPVADEKGE